MQGVFTGLIALDLTIRVIAGTVDTWEAWPVAALVLAGVAFLLAVTVPWERFPAEAICLLPVVDIAVVGTSRLGSLGAGVGVLVLLPAYWLGRTFGRLGVLVTLATGLLTVTLPGLLVLPSTGDNITRSLLIPGVGAFAAWAAQAISGTLDQLRREREAAEADRDRLAGALEFIEHQGRVSDAIIDTVDVGLLLLDAEGNYQSMNRRHRDFMRVAFPDGTGAAWASWGWSSTRTATGGSPARRCRPRARPAARSSTTAGSGSVTTR